jgi:hypothetical protein
VTGQVEMLIDGVDGTVLGTGAKFEGLRVRYRQAGTRRWSKFIVVRAPGQSLLDLLVAAIAVVSHVDAQHDVGKLDGVQITLDLSGARA